MHHAYLVEGSRADFESLKTSVQPFVATWYERFGIDDARELVAQASLKREGESTYLIGASTLATEAQQALLKLFEEPRPGLQFMLVVPHGSVLETLRSRMMTWEESHQPAGQKSSGRPSSSDTTRLFAQQAADFLKASGKERSDIIAAILKDDEGVKERVRELLDGLESELHKKIADPAARAALRDIAIVRDYVRDRSPSLKMLLEHLALSVPIF